MCPDEQEIWRRLSPGERISLALEWSERGRQLIFAELRRRFPAADDQELLHRYAHINLGPDLFRKAYGDIALSEPIGGEPPLRIEEFLELAGRLGMQELLKQHRELTT